MRRSGEFRIDRNSLTEGFDVEWFRHEPLILRRTSERSVVCGNEAVNFLKIERCP